MLTLLLNDNYCRSLLLVRKSHLKAWTPELSNGEVYDVKTLQIGF